MIKAHTAAVRSVDALRLALQAFVGWWDPRSTPLMDMGEETVSRHRSKCPDEVKQWVRDAYVVSNIENEREWALFVGMVDFFFPGRIEPQSATAALRKSSSSGSTPAINVAMNTTL